MKNRDRFVNIEERSTRKPFETNPARLQAAYDTWASQRGHYTLRWIAKDMGVNYSMLVDLAVQKLQELYPDIEFPEKRPEIVPEMTWQEMARREAELHYDDDDINLSFEIFAYLGNP